MPFVILPHADNPEFAHVLPVFKNTHHDKNIIELKDSQAIIFEGDKRRLVEATADSLDKDPSITEAVDVQ